MEPSEAEPMTELMREALLCTLRLLRASPQINCAKDVWTYILEEAEEGRRGALL
jgi:hypothetical protein